MSRAAAATGVSRQTVSTNVSNSRVIRLAGRALGISTWTTLLSTFVTRGTLDYKTARR